MPVLYIDGPSGLTKETKRQLIEEALQSLVTAYHMPDDRVYISEFALDEVGHTAYENSTMSIQSEPARIVCRIIAPPNLPIEAKRQLIKDLTEAVARAYEITNRRDILIFIDEHPIHNAASNGYLQNENPRFKSPATAQ